MKKIIILSSVLLLPSMVSAATLSVSPSSRSVNVGETFSVTVNLDTQGASIDGVDLRYLNYNPALLQVQDMNASTTGVQITPGTLMPATLSNNVSNGKIAFSQVVAGGSRYKGSGTLATVSFKALAGGNANLAFSYTSNKTTDSNVASAGKDILNAVINGLYSIKGSAGPVGTTNPNNVSSPNNNDAATSSITQNSSNTETSTEQTGEVRTQSQSFLASFFGALFDILDNTISSIKNIFLKVFSSIF